MPSVPLPVSGASIRNDNVLYQNMTFGQRSQQPGQLAAPTLPLLSGSPLLGPPQLPPKSHIPPPYRPPPTQFIDGPVLRSFEDEHHFHKGHLTQGSLTHHGTMAMSSSDGGSHDSHNDSGYCVRGSGGPSPSLSGSQGRPDSRGPPLMEVHDPPSGLQPPVLKASLGPVISNGSSVAPRIRQLQMQLSTTTTTTSNPTCAPRGSLV